MRLTEVKNRFSAAAGCDALYEVADEKVGRIGYIALHDLCNGLSVGGIRRWTYVSDREAVMDAVLLAEQMTLKTTLAGLPAGGAKAVVMDRPGLDLATAYGAMGEAIEALGGQFFSGADIGTGEVELAHVRARTVHVNLVENDPATSTAAGVLSAIHAAMQHLDLDWPGFTAVVQGAGSIGGLVAAGLASHGARVRVSDLRPERVAAVHHRWPTIHAISATEDVATEAVLLSPCAVGPVVTALTLPTLRCKIICGAANNQLATPCLADPLAEAGILYVPDFAVNAGAVIEGVLTRVYGATDDVRARIADEINAIGARVASILAEAAESEWTPLEVALSRMERPRPVC